MGRRFSPEAQTSLRILQQILRGGLPADYKIRNRELGILKRLVKLYPPLDFWDRLRPAIPLDTLLELYGGARASLEEEWHMYRFMRAQEEIEKDKELERNVAKLEESLAPVNPLDNDDKTSMMKSKAREHPLAWTD